MRANAGRFSDFENILAKSGYSSNKDAYELQYYDMGQGVESLLNAVAMAIEPDFFQISSEKTRSRL